MSISFPGESTEYRIARDELLVRETELRGAMEAVAAARRELPPGGVVPEDYAFQGKGSSGDPMEVRLSELFAPGRDSPRDLQLHVPARPGRRSPGAGERGNSCPAP